MKIYRVIDEGREVWGVGAGDRIELVDAGCIEEVASARRTGRAIDLATAGLGALAPSKIVCVGRNYADHAKELGNEPPPEPILFLKPPSAMLRPGGSVVLPPQSQRVDFEGELGIVIGRRARNIQASSWRDFVLGFCAANDVTARDLQRKDVQFTRGKSFDTFCPAGPCIETDLDPSDLAIVTRVDGEVRQNGRTSQMIFPPAFLLEFITSVMTLEPGDLILTGTPAGVGPLAAGQTVEVEIEGIGVLTNRVTGAEPAQ